MIKFVFVIFATSLLVEGVPLFPLDLAEAAKSDNWEKFKALLNLNSFDLHLPANLAGSVESLKPSDGTHVYGHAISSYKDWHNDNGVVSQNSKGYEVENIDGQVSKRFFKP